MAIEIARRDVEAILSHARAQDPEEACGLLIGRDERVTEVVAAPNSAGDRKRAFEVDPAVLLAVHRRARAAGQQLLGCYHSHPGGALLPSTCDAERADQPGFLWLIAARDAIGAFRAEAEGPIHGRFAPCTLLLIEDGGC